VWINEGTKTGDVLVVDVLDGSLLMEIWSFYFVHRISLEIVNEVVFQVLRCIRSFSDEAPRSKSARCTWVYSEHFYDDGNKVNEWAMCLKKECLQD